MNAINHPSYRPSHADESGSPERRVPCECADCGASLPPSAAAYPAYVVAVKVDSTRVLHRDEYGCAAAYASSPARVLVVRNGHTCQSASER